MVVNAATPLVNQMLIRRTVTIVWHNDKKPLDHGTGVLLHVGNVPLVITAAHVIRGRPMEELQLVATGQLSNLRSAPENMDLMGGELDNKLDIAFLRLSQECAARMSAEREFISFDDFDVFPVGLPDDLVFLFGMAEVGHKALDLDKHSYGSLTYIDRISEDHDWSSAGERPLMLDVPYPETVENSFDRRETELPDPSGMSGGGIWRVSFKGDGIWTPEPRLVGIITEFDTKARKVEANRLEALLHLLALHFPEADAFMREEIRTMRNNEPA